MQKSTTKSTPLVKSDKHIFDITVQFSVNTSKGQEISYFWVNLQLSTAMLSRKTQIILSIYGYKFKIIISSNQAYN